MMYWKVTPDGRLVLSLFYRESYRYNYQIGDKSRRSGASIGYRREFDRISQLWRGNEKKKNK